MPYKCKRYFNKLKTILDSLNITRPSDLCRIESLPTEEIDSIIKCDECNLEDLDKSYVAKDIIRDYLQYINRNNHSLSFEEWEYLHLWYNPLADKELFKRQNADTIHDMVHNGGYLTKANGDEALAKEHAVETLLDNELDTWGDYKRSIKEIKDFDW